MGGPDDLFFFFFCFLRGVGGLLVRYLHKSSDASVCHDIAHIFSVLA